MVVGVVVIRGRVSCYVVLDVVVHALVFAFRVSISRPATTIAQGGESQ
jgi:hypothetical protein